VESHIYSLNISILKVDQEGPRRQRRRVNKKKKTGYSREFSKESRPRSLVPHQCEGWKLPKKEQ
jgi:hypothetical protein